MDTPDPLSEPVLPLPQWANIRLELLWAYQGRVGENYRHMRSNHSNRILAWLLLSGSVRVSCHNKEWHASAGQWIVLPKTEMQQDFSDDACLLSIHLTCQWETGEDILAERDVAIFDAARYPSLEKNARALIELVALHIPDAGTILDGRCFMGTYRTYLKFQVPLMIWTENIISVLLEHGRTFTYARSVDERVMTAARCLSTTPLRDPFPEALLRTLSGVGRVQLDRVFQRDFGMTTLDYWANRRLRAAKACLETTNKPLKELSAYLGFNHPANFTRWFVQKTGLSPSEFRRRTGE